MPGRNDPCPCGSGRKYKACCGRPQQAPVLAAPAGKLRPGNLTEAGAIAGGFSPLQQLMRLQPSRFDEPVRGALPADTGDAHAQAGGLVERARALMRQGRNDGAIRALREAQRLDPENAAIPREMGLGYLRGGMLPEAMTALQRALTLEPERGETHYQLGLAHELAGNDHQAVGAYRRAIELAPNHADAHSRLGEFLLANRRLDEAAAQFERAAALAGNNSRARHNRARALLCRGQTREAETTLRRAISLDRASALLQRTLGDVLIEEGRFGEAVEHLDRAIAIDPEQTNVYHSIALAKKFGAAERPLLARMEARLQQRDLADRYRMILHFAAGKALDDLKEYAAAMRHFDAANRIRRQLARPFDRAGLARRIDAVIERFSAEFFASHQGVGKPDARPVLILGMPRSGTTLTEQIISSHPEVAGGDELGFWTERAPDLVTGGADAMLAAADGLADGYRAVLRGVDADAGRVTDKMPFNFLWLGLIHLVFPRARIVHCRRNPIDTCLSIYSRHFTHPWDFASDRGDLVFFYRQYLRLMAHWRAVLPPQRLFEVDYEALTADPEPMTRRLIAFCGLAWDEACLRPQDNRRLVRTASIWQARQPVYRSSVERWRSYEAWIGELGALAEAGTPPSPSASCSSFCA
jgi:tetratricopeptide (TPR) repeat protein